jgi:hypothetical protein
VALDPRNFELLYELATSVVSLNSL